MRGEIALVARIVRHGDAVLGSVWSRVSRSVRAMSQSCWQGRPVRETAAGWGPLRRVGRGMVMCHDSTVMLSWGVNILSADPRCESGERRGFTHLTKIVTCRVLEAVT